MTLIYVNLKEHAQRIKNYVERHGINPESVLELEVQGLGVKGDEYKIVYFDDDGWLCTLEALVGITNGRS